ncbi:MAG: HDOD domain-containing protein [Desulfovibrio sp.]|uniref:HDOD domain-containing protein n=1 Tax=Desulfovibrio sp. 7SRBS1 TaxID=3378064 RepID=UPI003B3CF762
MNFERGQSFLARLSNLRHDLPFSPEVFKALFRQTSDGSYASLNDIAQTISQDQGLSARILTVANSAFYGLQSQVTSVSRAATVLGVKEIKNIVLALGVQGLSASLPPSADFSMKDYWKHQFQVATAARILAPEAGVDPDTAFTAGLLHDMGKLITAIHSWDDYTAILHLISEKNLAPCRAEDLYWGLDHGVVGGLVLRAWKLPAQLSEPVNWHHNPELAPEYQTEALLIGLSDGLIHSVLDDFPASDGCEVLIKALKVGNESAQQAAQDALDDTHFDHFISCLPI